jgi:hypothetical protein
VPARIRLRQSLRRDKNGAPFKGNDAMLAALPIDVIVFRGTGCPSHSILASAQRAVPMRRVLIMR